MLAYVRDHLPRVPLLKQADHVHSCASPQRSLWPLTIGVTWTGAARDGGVVVRSACARSAHEGRAEWACGLRPGARVASAHASPHARSRSTGVRPRASTAQRHHTCQRAFSAVEPAAADANGLRFACSKGDNRERPSHERDASQGDAVRVRAPGRQFSRKVT
jgi:hypothetical protein